MGGEPTSGGAGRAGGDAAFMRRALSLAERGLGKAAPNPMVGSVVVAGDEVVGEGWHEGPGMPHAEVVALAGAGPRARGGALYVTLEPCGHQGRTPPCAPAIVEAGIARVVVATRDPNPIVDGRGFEILRASGVEVNEGVAAKEATELIAGFAKHARTGLPFVVMKMAGSLDGKAAARDGSSRWITGEEARLDVHRLRAGSGALVVGAGTALADNPALTVRFPGYEGRPPLRVVVDAIGRVPATGALFDERAPTLVATTTSVNAAARASWEAAGAEVIEFDAEPGSSRGSWRVPLAELMATLGKRDVQTVMIEGGPTLAWAAIRAGVVDRFVLYLAPKLVGGVAAAGVLEGDGVAAIADAIGVGIEGVERVGDDIKVVASVHRDR